MHMSAVISGEKLGVLATRSGPGSSAESDPAAHLQPILAPPRAAQRVVSDYLLSALLNWSSAQAYAVGATLDQYFQLWLSPVSRW